MKTKKTKWDYVPQATIDPNLKSSRNSPFVVRKVEEAKRHLAGVDLSILGITDKF
ncbi:hypothetical protein [Dyadobacter sp. CY326]|uniref:hypothetical protein n=1 Tax=Dyadobacter sp. CY326 TaxID=2907300 RepID=UPI001F3A52CE|nr:hypothetical protein [Dyadobacter sp. CY326]MCE7067996.1 hypothetical protein [Dyadobacter sp. CY326]